MTRAASRNMPASGNTAGALAAIALKPDAGMRYAERYWSGRCGTRGHRVAPRENGLPVPDHGAALGPFQDVMGVALWRALVQIGQREDNRPAHPINAHNAHGYASWNACGWPTMLPINATDGHWR